MNEEFAKAVQQDYAEGDVVLIYDYHFMLLPLMLRHVRRHQQDNGSKKPRPSRGWLEPSAAGGVSNYFIPEPGIHVVNSTPITICIPAAW